MQKKNTQRGALPLLVSVVVVLLVLGGGIYFYQSNSEKSGKEAGEMDIKVYNAEDPVFASSPKGIFLARNQALYDSTSFDEMVRVANKYDTKVRQAANDKLFNSIDSDKKPSYLSFAQSLMQPNSAFTEVSESINGDSAVVVAFDKKYQRTTALFIKEGGSWKIDDIKTELTGESR